MLGDYCGVRPTDRFRGNDCGRECAGVYASAWAVCVEQAGRLNAGACDWTDDKTNGRKSGATYGYFKEKRRRRFFK